MCECSLLPPPWPQVLALALALVLALVLVAPTPPGDLRLSAALPPPLIRSPHPTLRPRPARHDVVPKILAGGFDWRLSGSSTGTLWGKGAYFANRCARECGWGGGTQIQHA